MIHEVSVTQSDWANLSDLESVREAAVTMGAASSSDIVRSLNFAIEFILAVLKKRNEAARRPVGYYPIVELPDVERCYVVFWNDCNGPHLEQVWSKEDAERHRTEGGWTHFVLLNENPPEESARIKHLIEANNRYLQRARDAERELAEARQDLQVSMIGQVLSDAFVRPESFVPKVGETPYQPSLHRVPIGPSAETYPVGSLSLPTA